MCTHAAAALVRLLARSTQYLINCLSRYLFNGPCNLPLLLAVMPAGVLQVLMCQPITVLPTVHSTAYKWGGASEGKGVAACFQSGNSPRGAVAKIGCGGRCSCATRTRQGEQ